MKIKHLNTITIDSTDFLALSPDGSQFVCNDLDEKLDVYNTKTGELTKKLSIAPYYSYTKSLVINSNYISSVQKKSISVFSRADYKKIYNLTGHKKEVQSLQFISNNVLASCDENSEVIIWDLKTGREVKRIDVKSEYEINRLWGNEEVIGIGATSKDNNKDCLLRYFMTNNTVEKVEEYEGPLYSFCNSNSIFIFDENQYYEYNVQTNSKSSFSYPEINNVINWDIDKQAEAAADLEEIHWKMVFEKSVMVGAVIIDDFECSGMLIHYLDKNVHFFLPESDNLLREIKNFDAVLHDNQITLAIYEQDLDNETFRIYTYLIDLD